LIYFEFIRFLLPEFFFRFVWKMRRPETMPARHGRNFSPKHPGPEKKKCAQAAHPATGTARKAGGLLEISPGHESGIQREKAMRPGGCAGSLGSVPVTVHPSRPCPNH
jgi:hypothetical protein